MQEKSTISQTKFSELSERIKISIFFIKVSSTTLFNSDIFLYCSNILVLSSCLSLSIFRLTISESISDNLLFNLSISIKTVRKLNLERRNIYNVEVILLEMGIFVTILRY